MRSVLVHIVDKQQAINEIYRILKYGGIFSAFEPIIRSNTRYYELLSPDNISDYENFKKAEMELMTSETDPLTNFDHNSLAKNLEEAGFKDAAIDLQTAESTYVATTNAIENWFIAPPSPGSLSMKERFLLYFDEQKVDNFIEEVKIELANKQITVKSNTALIKAVKN